jgi:hypothetical protein
MRRWASLLAIRRTSWIDQRIRGGSCEPACFWGGRGIRAVPDHGHHGEGEHDERHVAMPAVPGAGFIMIEPKLILGGLEASSIAQR